jgi:signal transduction histidine kinase
MNPTDELIALCQSQVNLLSQGLSADWVAVYGAKDWTEDLPLNLVPLAIYPQAKVATGEPIAILPQVWAHLLADRPRLPSAVEVPPPVIPPLPSSAIVAFGRSQAQVVLPLIYQGMILGLLVVRRRECPWQGQEMTQLESIAETLAIACLLDRRQLWYRQQLHQQLAQREIERDRLEDLFHQLRNPLTALKTFSKLLRRYLLGDEKSQSVVDSLLRESDRLEDLIQQFEIRQQEQIGESDLTLNMTAVPALTPSPDLDLEKVDLAALLAPILNSAEAIARERSIQLCWNESTTVPLVWGNAKALTESLTNLIDNAIKYTPDGGRVKVALGQKRVEDDREFLAIEVCDTGCGISPGDRERIFERHFRGIQAEGAIPGTGLGLAIAEEAIEKMGGAIELQSPNPYLKDADYPGTCFTVWLAIAES